MPAIYRGLSGNNKPGAMAKQGKESVEKTYENLRGQVHQLQYISVDIQACMEEKFNAFTQIMLYNIFVRIINPPLPNLVIFLN